MLNFFRFAIESDRLRELEEQQELLNSSLIALTSHFAQVQFRLRQIIDAPAQDKEILLQDLEEFAFKGIPDIPDSGYQMILHQVRILILQQKKHSFAFCLHVLN